MISLILNWILFSLVVMLIAWLIPGIYVSGFKSALILSLVIGLLNVFVRPILSFITFPINLLTLGLMGIVLNTLLFMLAGHFTKGVQIDGFLPALLGSLILGLFSGIIFGINNH